MSPWCCRISVSRSSSRFLAKAVSVSTSSSILFSLSVLFRLYVSGLFSAKSFALDRKLQSTATAGIHSASMSLLRSFTWWCHHVQQVINYLYLPVGCGAKCFSEHRPLYIVMSLLMGSMLVVTTYGPRGGMLDLLCQGWYIRSTWTKHNLRVWCHWMGNSNGIHGTWIDLKRVFQSKIPGRLWDKDDWTSAPSNNILWISITHEVSAVVHLYLSW